MLMKLIIFHSVLIHSRISHLAHFITDMSWKHPHLTLKGTIVKYLCLKIIQIAMITNV